MTPRVGFLGTGWIGCDRMRAMLADGTIEATAICDTSPNDVARAVDFAPDAQVVDDLDAMLALGLDGVVIATPSALHADQAIRALGAGCAVFCQKPLGRDATEVAAVIAAARAADRLLGVDLSYRHTAAVRGIAELVRSDELGNVFAVDLTFHNAYGPDKGWFYDPNLSGGGCLLDLGVHLIDLALWTLEFPPASDIQGILRAHGGPLNPSVVEDYAAAHFTLGGAAVRLACSWRLHAGSDAVIGAAFYGTKGGAALRNVGGSFTDFVAEHFTGTATRVLAEGPDDWGGRAAVAWGRRLGERSGYDADADRLLASAEVIDGIYAVRGQSC